MVVSNPSTSTDATAVETRRTNPFRWFARIVLMALRSEGATQRPPSPPTHPLQPGLSKLELANLIRSRFYEDRQWARDRRSVWSARSTLLRFLMFTVSVLAIVFLGIASLDGFAIVGFICTAVGTALAALETFFNWRSRWIAADAALAQWHEAEEALSLYVASRPAKDLVLEDLLDFDERRRAAWSQMSQTWLNDRRGNAGAAGEGSI